MKDRSNEARLQELTAPAPDPVARARAREAALAEFSRLQAANESSQDSVAPARLSPQATGGSKTMKRTVKWLVPRSVFGAFASACLVVTATAMLWPIFTNRVPVENGYVQLEPVPTAPVGGEPVRRDPVTPAAAAQAEKPQGAAASPGMSDRKQELVKENARSRVRIAPADARSHESVGTAQTAKDDMSGLAHEPAVITQMPPDAGPPAPVTVVSSDQLREETSEVVVTGARISQSSAQRLPPKAGAATRGRDSSGGFVVNQAPAAPPPALSRAGVSGGIPAPLEKKLINGFEAEGDDRFQTFEQNTIRLAASDPVSTFSVDVDTASYGFVRRMLNGAQLPQKDAVRVEEMINYFDYAWPKAEERGLPFAPTIVVSDSPWNKGRKLVHIGIKGYDVPRDRAPDVNLVLLLDVSGSMNSPDKLPLAVQSMELLLSSLKPSDTVGIVVYAGAAGKVLDPTPVADRQKIVDALRELTPGGSTAGAEGIELAYQLAEKNFRKGGVNRILLATDGDFNVGIDQTEELKSFVERKRRSGVMLSVLGFGQGNYRDELAQALAQNGNGVAVYIDTLSEAQKTLVQESSGALFTIAKDVKIQVEFNPATVSEYRLVGYETRALKREDFNNDAVDAGDVGSGHTVTAIYEIAPVGSGAASVDPLRYPVTAPAAPQGGNRNEYGFLKIRYKLPGEESSRLMSRPIAIETGRLSALVQREVQFSTAVAGFGQLLRGGTYAGSLTLDDVLALAQAAKGDDPFGYRTEFVQLVRKAKTARGN